MANGLYDYGREGFLDETLNWLSDDVRAILVDSASYTPNLATDQFLSSVPVIARIAVSSSLTGKTNTEGVAGANDTTFALVSGPPIEALVFYKHTGVDGTARLIAYIDTATGLPFTPSGGNIVVQWQTSGDEIFLIPDSISSAEAFGTATVVSIPLYPTYPPYPTNGNADYYMQVEGTGIKFVTTLPARVRASSVSFAPQDTLFVTRFAASLLAEMGQVDGRTFAFMRKAIPFNLDEAAAYLGVPSTTIQDWEANVIPITRESWVAMGDLTRRVTKRGHLSDVVSLTYPPDLRARTIRFRSFVPVTQL